MKKEFKTINGKTHTRYVLETTTAGATGSSVIATSEKPLGELQKRQTVSVPVTQKPRQGPLRPQTGGGAHRDKKKEQKQGKEKHRKPFMEDHEISMASNELQAIAKNAVHLLDLVRKYSEQEGLEAWQQSKITKAADYLNSVLQSISGEQSTLEGLRDPKDNPCWKGYKPVGTKKKAGKTVPNCVPKESLAEGIGGLGYDAQSLITKLRRDVEEKRLKPTPEAILAAARELAGDMEFAPQLLVKQVLGQGVAEGFGSNYAEQLAQQVFDHNPSLDNEDAILNLGYNIAKSELGSRARGIFRSEDFPSDFVSAYSYLKNQGVDESGLQYYTGVKKHGAEYMKKAAAAGRAGASQKELGALKDKYSKAYKDESISDEYMESIANKLNAVLQEKAPPGDKYERMVKHIKKGYAKDGKLTDVEKSKAYGAAWKAKNKAKK